MKNRKGRKERKKERKKERQRIESLVSEAPNLQTALASFVFVFVLFALFFVFGKGSRQVTSRFGVSIIRVLYEVGIVKPRGRFL